MRQKLTLSVAETSELTGMSPHTIRRGIRERTVPSIKVGRIIRVPLRPLLRLLGDEPAANEEAQA